MFLAPWLLPDLCRIVARYARLCDIDARHVVDPMVHCGACGLWLCGLCAGLTHPCEYSQCPHLLCEHCASRLHLWESPSPILLCCQHAHGQHREGQRGNYRQTLHVCHLCRDLCCVCCGEEGNVLWAHRACLARHGVQIMCPQICDNDNGPPSSLFLSPREVTWLAQYGRRVYYKSVLGEEDEDEEEEEEVVVEKRKGDWQWHRVDWVPPRDPPIMTTLVVGHAAATWRTRFRPGGR